MGRPNKSKILRRNNLTRTATHRCHRATIDCTPEEVTGSGNIAKYIEEACIWADGDDDELAENAQQEVWSISSDSSSVAVLDSEEEDNTHQSNLHHFSTILSKGLASWYQSVTDARASNKQPHQYRGDSHTSWWRASKVAQNNGQTIRSFFNPVVSMQI